MRPLKKPIKKFGRATADLLRVFDDDSAVCPGEPERGFRFHGAGGGNSATIQTSPVFDEINRAIVKQQSLLQLLFWQLLFLDIGKIYRVIHASTGHQIESLSGSIFGVTTLAARVRCLAFIFALHRSPV
jgi:hypothetical protein